MTATYRKQMQRAEWLNKHYPQHPKARERDEQHTAVWEEWGKRGEAYCLQHGISAEMCLHLIENGGVFEAEDEE